MRSVHRILKIIFLSFILICCSLVTHSEVVSLLPSPFENECKMMTDKPFYVTGETMHYSIFMPSQFNNSSTSLKFIIADANGNVLDKYFLKPNNHASVHGNYKFPYSLATSNYQVILRAINRTSFKETTLVKSVIPVYNDLVSLNQIEIQKNRSFVPNSFGIKDINEISLSISVEQSAFKQRGTVSGSIGVSDLQGNPIQGRVVLYAVDKELVPEADKPFIQIGPELKSEEIAFFSDQIITHGQLLDRDGELVNANILGAYSDEENQFYFTRSDANGKFFLQLPDFSENKQIQFIAFQKEHDFVESKLVTENIDSIKNDIVYNEYILKYLKLSQIRKKISQYYGQQIQNNSGKNETHSVRDLIPDEEYIISEYESFKNMASFFKENLTPLRFRNNNDNFTAYMYNPASKNSGQDMNFDGIPLFIVDGNLTQNSNYIANLEMSQVEKVEMFFNPKKLRTYFNVFGNSGVIRITTNIDRIKLPADDSQNIHNIKGLQTSSGKKAMPSEWQITEANFDPVVYWNAAMESNEKGLCPFEFTHSDDKGEFVLLAVAYNAQGKIGYSTFNYQVK